MFSWFSRSRDPATASVSPQVDSRLEEAYRLAVSQTRSERLRSPIESNSLSERQLAASGDRSKAIAALEERKRTYLALGARDLDGILRLYRDRKIPVPLARKFVADISRMDGKDSELVTLARAAYPEVEDVVVDQSVPKAAAGSFRAFNWQQTAQSKS